MFENHILAEHGAVLRKQDAAYDMLHSIEQAKERINLHTMVYWPGGVVDDFTDVLKRKAKEGLEVKLVVDDYSTLITKIGQEPIIELASKRVEFLNRITKYISSQARQFAEYQRVLSQNLQVFEDLRESGVEIRITTANNVIADYIPQLKRDHAKYLVVDDKLYFGGINWVDSDFNREDFMVKITNQAVVNYLAKCFQETFEFGDLNKNGEYPINSHYNLVVDPKNFSSPGLDLAALITRTAQEQVSLLSHYSQNGRLLMAMHEAQVPVTVITGDTSEYHRSHDFFFEDIPRFVTELFCPNKSRIMELEHPNEIHSKLIMNESQALFGSLNLTEASALAQASELCLRTTDPVLMQNFRNYFQMLKEEATFKK